MKSVFLKLAASAAIIVGASQVASAADLPAKAPAVYPVHAPVMNWTGLYIGGHVGSGWGTVSSDLGLAQLGLLGGGTLAVGSGNVNGVLYGGQLGYNWQIGGWVVGIEGSISGADIDGSAACLATIPCSSKTNMIATVTGRIGGLMIGSNLLGYVKGGWAWKDTDYDLNFSTAGASIVASASETRSGYVVGAGFEYNFSPNWTGFIEYNYMDFGRDDIAFNVATTPALGFPATITSGIDDRLHVLKAGVNYKFWGGGGRWGY